MGAAPWGRADIVLAVPVTADLRAGASDIVAVRWRKSGQAWRYDPADGGSEWRTTLDLPDLFP